MTVYVEYVFLDNFLIDWVLVTLARKSLKLSAEKRWVCLASVIGATFAVIFPFFRVNAVVGLFIKGAIGLIIVFFSGKFRSCRQFLKCFYLITNEYIKRARLFLEQSDRNFSLSLSVCSFI